MKARKIIDSLLSRDISRHDAIKEITDLVKKSMGEGYQECRVEKVMIGENSVRHTTIHMAPHTDIHQDDRVSVFILPY